MGRKVCKDPTQRPVADLCRGKVGAHPKVRKPNEDGTTLKVFGSAFYNGLRPICVEERPEPIPRLGSPMRMGLH